MFKKSRFEEIETSQKGTAEIERMLRIMPKNCSCSACTAIKNEAKSKLSKSKYFNIVHA